MKQILVFYLLLAHFIVSAQIREKSQETFPMSSQAPFSKQLELNSSVMDKIQENPDAYKDDIDIQKVFALEKKIEDDLGKEDQKTIMDPNEIPSDRLFGPSQYDSRIEPLQLNTEIDWQAKMLQTANSVGMLVEREKLTQISKNIYQIDISNTLGTFYQLCTDEAFYNQPTAGVATAFILGEKEMITALHAFERPLSLYVVIFGYKIIDANGIVDVFVDKNDVYYPKAITKKNTELDLVEFAVDRNFDRPVLEWENSTLLSPTKNEIYMVGYPIGLPLKIALNASITKGNNPYYYYTSLDSFQGNSGSPVFNFYTNKVIGVLVSGEIDYAFNGNCYYSPVCKIPYCKGEKVIRIERFME